MVTRWGGGLQKSYSYTDLLLIRTNFATRFFLQISSLEQQRTTFMVT